MKADKNYCASSFLALRFIFDEDKTFKEGLKRTVLRLPSDDGRIPCYNVTDIDKNIKSIIDDCDLSHVALLLSGGIDSGILASYMPKGTKAYTIHNESKKNDLEVARAAKICQLNKLEHKIIEVTWQDYLNIMDKISLDAGYPVFGNTPQLYYGVKAAIDDGAKFIIIGDDADSVFGGYNLLLSKDWKYNDFIKRFMFIDPEKVLKHPVDMGYVFEPYKLDNDGIDFIGCIKYILNISTGVAYYDIFNYFNIPAIDPYSKLKMGMPLDLARIRNGEPKYLLRELYKEKYPTREIPEKIPMARPMDLWMANWQGPKRDEFIPNCIDGLTGEQKFNIYSLERFMNVLNI